MWVHVYTYGNIGPLSPRAVHPHRPWCITTMCCRCFHCLIICRNRHLQFYNVSLDTAQVSTIYNSPGPQPPPPPPPPAQASPPPAYRMAPLVNTSSASVAVGTHLQRRTATHIFRLHLHTKLSCILLPLLCLQLSIASLWRWATGRASIFTAAHFLVGMHPWPSHMIRASFLAFRYSQNTMACCSFL